MASLTQTELAAVILDIVSQIDPNVVTFVTVVDMLAAHFGVDRAELKVHRSAIKALVMSGLSARHKDEQHASDEDEDDDDEDDDDVADKENVDGSPEKKKKRRLHESAASRQKPTRRANVISDESEEESEQEEEENGDDDEGSESQGSGSERDAPSKKRASSKSTPGKRKAASSTRGAPARKKSTPAAKKPKQSDPPGLAALKEMARSARLLSPRIYAALKKFESEQEQEEYIRDLLRANRVKFSGKYPQKREIDEVRKKKELEKELEGIDTSLIIQDDSRSRRASRSQVSYADQLTNHVVSDDDERNGDEEGKSAGHEEEEDEEDDDDDDAFAASDSDSSEAAF